MTTKRMLSSNRAKIEKAFTRQADRFESAKTQKSKGCCGGVIQPQYPRKADFSCLEAAENSASFSIRGAVVRR